MSGSIFILYVKDQQASCDFYASVFNEKPVLDVPGMTEFRLSESSRLGLMPEKNIGKLISPPLKSPSDHTGSPRCELYLYVDNPAEFWQRALYAGAREVSPVSERDWGDEAGYVADPDGHVLVFAKKI